MSLFKTQLSDTYEVENQIKIYDYNRCLDFILERGKSIYGGHFIITKSQKDTFFKLFAYAIEDSKNLNREALDINKGLMLIGEAETGKTAMMRLIKDFFSHKKQYYIKTARIFSQEFSQKGFESINPLFQSHAKPLCLDNIGKENIAKHYGFQYDAVYSIVEHFYEQRYDQGYPKLHITTALSARELENRYGAGFRKMLQAMFNVIICE